MPALWVYCADAGEFLWGVWGGRWGGRIMTNRKRFALAFAICVVAVLLPWTYVEMLLLWAYVEMFKSWAESNLYLVQTYATIILAFFNFVFIAILFWDRYTDKPNLEIKMEEKTKISDFRYYTFGVYVLNKGRKDAHNCHVSVQVFNQKSGKKIIDERLISEHDLKSGETKSFSLNTNLAFDGEFVARISAETHKSKASKILEYNIRNYYDPIIFKWGFVQHCRFHLKRLFKIYRNEWDTEFLANGLTTFSDPNIREKLMMKLGKIGDNSALEPIIARLENDPSGTVRNRAVVALGNIGDKRAIDPLLKCLRENKASIRFCTSAIEKICDKECVNELIGILLNRNFPTETRREVVKSLGEIGKKIEMQTIEKALIESLKDFEALEEITDKSNAICSVVEALGKIGSEKSEEALKRLDEKINQDCSDTYKKALEQIQFVISIGGNWNDSEHR
jgi:hypothetical protein